MCIALIGGMDRLERVYEQEAERFGVKLKVFTKITKNLGEKICNADAVIVFTNKVSYTSKREVMNEARSGLLKWFERYDKERPHSARDDSTPHEADFNRPRPGYAAATLAA